MPEAGRRAPAWLLVPVLVVLLSAAGWGALALARRASFTDYPDEEVASIRYVHAYRGAPLCQACHEGKDGALRAPPTQTCTRCHAEMHGSHPYDIPQPHPEQCTLPLHDGMITCHTCHDPHDTRTQRAGLWAPFNELCQRCHAGR